MTLLRTTTTDVKTSPALKVPISIPTVKSPSTMKKPVDLNSPTRKFAIPPSSIKGKITPAPSRSPTKAENSPIKMEKSPLKLTISKTNITPMIKTPPASNKNQNPTSKSSVAEIRSPIRNAIKPITSSKTFPEKKLLNSKKDNLTSTTRLSEKSASKTNVSSVSTSRMATKSSSPAKNTLLSPVKSISPLTKSAPSTNKSVLSPIKSVSPSVKSSSSPVKLISSPIKSKITCEVNASNRGNSRGIKTNQLSPISSVKNPINLLKSSINKPKASTSKVDVSTKLKPIIKHSPTSKVVKNNSIPTKTVSKQSTVAATIEVSRVSSLPVEKVDLCHCDDTTKKCEELINSAHLITEYTAENTGNFDVVQAFKVAEQLIKIQSSDRNLETIIETCENSSVVNWDDVITPCDDFDVCNPNDKNELPPFKQKGFFVTPFIPDESILKRGSYITEITSSNCTPSSKVLNTEVDVPNEKLAISVNRDENNNIIEIHDAIDPFSALNPSNTEVDVPNEKLAISVNRDENNNIIEIHDAIDPFSALNPSSVIVPHNEEHFTNELESKISDDDSIENHGNENESGEVESNDEEYSTKEESKLPEWTITIDEFSLELSQKEIQSSDVNEIMAEKENYIADKIPFAVGVSYADILKKAPKVLTDATNSESHRKEPKLDDEVQVKGYPALKKSKTWCSKNMLNNIDNNFEICDYNDLYEEPEYSEMRKKKYKKIKHLPKRHLRNVSREYEYIENHTDLFVTQVWKNIF